MDAGGGGWRHLRRRNRRLRRVRFDQDLVGLIQVSVDNFGNAIRMVE
jgi:hypothetical protein